MAAVPVERGVVRQVAPVQAQVVQGPVLLAVQAVLPKSPPVPTPPPPEARNAAGAETRGGPGRLPVGLSAPSRDAPAPATSRAAPSVGNSRSVASRRRREAEVPGPPSTTA